MKLKFILFFLITYLFVHPLYSQTIYISENFDAATKPLGWTYQYPSGAIDWQYQDGGYTSGGPGTGEPPYAFQGERNAMFYYASISNETTKLITPAFDLSYGIKPELVFWHAQVDKLYAGSYNHDELRIYYRISSTDPWVLLEEYIDEVTDWTERRIQLPDSALSSTYYIAFEGKTQNGFGTCIDSMFVIETGITPKYIESLTVSQPIKRVVPTSSLNNRILQVEVSVKGNDGSIKLDSIGFISLNTNDNDIQTNGVKLYASDDIYFYNAVQIGAGANFTDGKISFDNLNHELPTGLSTLWLTYDIIDDTNHELQDNILDAYLPENGAKISGNYFPPVDQSPSGDREITESIFYDNFESGLTWTLSGEFEHDTPQGLGGSIGTADPENATSGTYIIGTDLSGLGSSLGDYESNIDYHDNQAITPTIDAEYYKSTILYFSRWLNIEVSDSALIEYSDDGGAVWNKIWLSNSTITDKNWQYVELDTKNYLDKTKDIKLNFSLGGSNSSWNLSGWNIDDVFLTGNYISKDVGISEWIAPVNGCGHTDEEYVRVIINNYAGDSLKDPLPLSYSFDGGMTIYYDTIQAPDLPVKGSIDYIITKPIDLTTPGWYNNVYATTNLPGDEESTNDKILTSIFISPTYTLPYYQNFETNYGYYLSGGKNSTWEYGIPNGTLINSAASGTKAWVINLDGNYYNNDSSFIESPCFDFSGIDTIVFEFKCKGISEDKTDGLTLLYSLDQGSSWNVVPNDNDFYWNWYTETYISALELPGIDTTNGEWTTFRQLLPPALSNQSSVKFRFAFESNINNPYEGFGIDDIKIYKAPYDVGVSAMAYPYTKCELSDTTHVRVYVKNYGITNIISGTKIPLVLDFNSNIINDTLTLASDLNVLDSTLFTFDSTVDMSYAGDYDFIINTNLESNSYFYNDTLSNDTLTTTITVQGMPRYDIGWIVGSEDLDTLLDAGAGYNSYSWYHGGSEVSTFQTYRATAQGLYYVTVSNTIPCYANDSLKVVPSLVDVKMDSIRTILVDECERFDSTIIRAAISNKGEILNTGDTIPFGYQVNNLPEVHDTLILTTDLLITHPDDTVTFTFTKKCNLMNPGEYKIRVFTNFLGDLNRKDDTITVTINTWGLPDVNLEYDTIYSSQADTLLLDAGPGFLTYNWNSGSMVQTETPTNSSYYYVVTVTDVHSCSSDKDSTYIETHDFGISAVNYPLDTCENEVLALTNINIDLVNYSSNTYSSTETVDIFYNYDNTGWVNVTPQLGTNMLANDTISLDIDNIDISNPGEHTLKIYTSSNIDANHTNDTIEYSFNTWEYPDVELIHDTIFTIEPDTVVLYPTLGFDTYNWSDGSTNDTLIVTNNATFNYVVTVTDVNGCGSDKDSTMIITYDLEINAIVSPINKCSHTSTETITISITNNSNDILYNGETIDVGYIFNKGIPVSEVYTLTSDFYPSQTRSYNFTNKVDMSSAGTYTLKAYTAFELDANRENDTIYNGIKTYGYPIIDIGPDIYTNQPDTVELIANPGYNNYSWNEGTKNDTLLVTKPESFEYIVTVTNINGCKTLDSATVYTSDVRASALISPETTCEFTSAETVTVEIENNCSDTILSGETIEVSYKIGSGSFITENMVLSDDLLPDSTAQHSFTTPVDLSVDGSYTFKIFAKYSIDVFTNDTISTTINEVGYPSFSLGPDIYTTNPVGTMLTAPGGYDSYLWQDGSTNNTFTISYPASAQYSVTVADIYGCATPDTLEVFTYDISMSSINTPYTTCEFTSSELLNVSVLNNSKDTLLTGQNINIGYSLNGGAVITEVLTLTSDLFPDSTVEYTFVSTLDLTSASNHNIEVNCSMNINVDTSNDTIDIDIEAVGYPSYNLGSDIYATNPVGTILTTPGGYNSYLWQDGSTNNTFTISYPASAQYSVTVADIYGCATSDTLDVFTYNVAADTLTTPVSQCILSNSEVVRFTIINNSPDTLLSGETVDIGYILNSGTIVSESFNLSETLYPDSVTGYTFTQQADLSANQIHELKLFAKLANIDVELDDTVTENVDYMAPLFDLGDPVVTGDAQYTIDAGGGFLSYLWFDASTNQTYVVDINNQNPNRYYSVTVSTFDGCSANDSIEVTFTTTGDLEITSLSSPVSDCWVDGETYPVHIEITNSGVVNLTPGTSFIVGYKIDGGTEVTENFNLSAAMNANDTREHTFTSEISFATAKEYQFKPFVTLSDDGDRSNDTLITILDISAPEVSLGITDTVYFDESYEISTLETYTSYSWSTGATTPSITITQTGKYWVVVTDALGCQGTDTIYCERNTGIDHIISGDGYNLTYYPNPATDNIMIQFNNSRPTDIFIQIVSANGQIIYNNELKDIEDYLERIEVNSYSKGVYYLRFKINDDFYTRKMILQ